ncbi:MAG: hypothetical protein JWR01_661 [Subtercola sp.]|nr:hypothetical protein [Subtercola sp.]
MSDSTRTLKAVSALYVPTQVGVDDRSLSSQVYAEIRERIIEGIYPAGARLRERELSDDLKVSRIPVREALPQLEADGYIVTYPRRGAVVRQLTLVDVQELFDIRLALEVFAARKAAERARVETLSPRLDELVKKARTITNEFSPREISTINTQIHEEIIRLADSELLDNLMRTVMGRTRWLFRLTSDRDQNEQFHDHDDLARAIYGGNADIAAAIAHTHIENGRQPSVELLKGILPAHS